MPAQEARCQLQAGAALDGALSCGGQVGDYVNRIEWMDGSYRKPELVHATRLKAYSAIDLVTPALPAPEDFEQPLPVEPEEEVPPLERQANQHKQRRQLAQHEEREISEEHLALVGRYFKYGGPVYAIKSVAYDQELKMDAVRYRLVKEKEIKKPEEAEELVNQFGGW